MESKHYEQRQCIIEFQAFRDNKNKFIIKELVILDLNTNVPYSFVFKPPYNVKQCNLKSGRTNKWLSRNYHCINWLEGDVEYSELNSIMGRFCKNFHIIYTTGNEKAAWISKYTTKPVVQLHFSKVNNSNSYEHVLPLCLNVSNPKHKVANCSLAKVYNLVLQLKKCEMSNVEGVKVEGVGGPSI